MNPRRVYISHGNEADRHLDYLKKRSAGSGRCDGWTVHSQAQPDDVVLFYFKAPISAIVARGVVASTPKRKAANWGRNGYSCFSSIRDIRMLDPFVGLKVLRREFPDWRWLKSPQSAPRVPDEFVGRLLSLISAGNHVRRIIEHIPDNDANPPPRIRMEVSRVVRNSASATALKELYEGQCQVCNQTIELPSGGGRYCEVHHLRPLGRTHAGSDAHENMLVLCPTCHVKFDLLVMAVHPETLRIHGFDGERVRVRCTLRVLEDHHIDGTNANVKYHWWRFKQQAEPR